jgi:WD40 repeat protein
MSLAPAACPKCGSTEIRFREKRCDWLCDACDHHWRADPAATSDDPTSRTANAKLFFSYGRRDAKQLVDRLCVDLTALGYQCWQDTGEIKAGTSWQHEIADGLRSAQIVVAVMTPHSVRVSTDPKSPDNVDSVCLGEIAYALYNPPTKPVVPVMALSCEPPVAIYHLDYVDMRSWSESEDQYQSGLIRLQEAVAAGLRGEKRYRDWYHMLDPWDFAPFLHEKREGFVGRQWLFDELDAWRVSSRSERTLLITGDPGVGKSAVVAELVHSNPGGQVLAHHCCQASTPATLEPWRFVRSLAAMIAGKLPEFAAQLSNPGIKEILSETSCKEDPGSALERGLLTLLHTVHAPAEGVRYLLIDALDEALLHTGPVNIVDLLATRLGRFPPWLRIVATTRKEPDVIKRLRGLRAQEIDSQDPRNLEDIDIYIRARLETPNLAERVVASGLPVEKLSLVLRKKSDGNFLYLRQALDGIETDQFRLNNLDALPPGLFGLYEEFFRRRFPDVESFADAQRILQVVTAAREPLDEDQLARATAIEPRRALPHALRALSVYLRPRRDDEGKVRYVPYHKSLIDWLTDEEQRGTLYSIDRRDGHEQLARMCWSEYQSGARSLSPYALAHLARHLIGAERWADLEAVLTDLDFLEAKNEEGLLFDLAGDFTQAIEALPANRPSRRILCLLDEALRRDIHFIDWVRQDYPQGLFQCLWNSCWWYDADGVEEHYRKSEVARPFWKHDGAKLSVLLDDWRKEKEERQPGFTWVRSLRPPKVHLGSAQRAVLRGHSSNVGALAFSPDGALLVSGGWDGALIVWDRDSGMPIHRFEQRGHQIHSIAISPDGRLVAAPLGPTVYVLDLASLEIKRTLAVRAESVAFLPDGRLACGDNEGKIWVWEIDSGQLCAKLDVHTNCVQRIAACHRSDLFATATWDCVAIFDSHTLAPLQRFEGHHSSGWINCLAISPDGVVVSGDQGGQGNIWDARSGTLIASFSTNHLYDGDFSSDGRLIVTASALAPNAMFPDEPGVQVWDARSGASVKQFVGHDNTVHAARFSPSGQEIASGSRDQTIRLWDLSRDATTMELKGHAVAINGVSFSPDGKYLATSSHDGSVGLWNANSGCFVEPLPIHEDKEMVQASAFSPDGRLVMSAAWDGTARVWDLEERTCLAVLNHRDRGENRDKTAWVDAIAFSPDGKHLATGCHDNLVRIWDGKTFNLLHRLRGHGSDIRCVAFSPNGLLLASGASDQTVRIWEVASGQSIARIDCEGVLGGMDDIAFALDGTRLAAGSVYEQSVTIWDVTTFRVLARLTRQADAKAALESSTSRPWRAGFRHEDLTIRSAESGNVAGIVPVQCWRVAGGPDGRTWAAVERLDKYLHYLALEGGTRLAGTKK